jgi:hypothetical protein
MGLEIRDLVEKVRQASETLSKRDSRIDGIEHGLNEIYRIDRPGFGAGERSDDLERKSAIALCQRRHRV